MDLGVGILGVLEGEMRGDFWMGFLGVEGGFGVDFEVNWKKKKDEDF